MSPGNGVLYRTTLACIAQYLGHVVPDGVLGRYCPLRPSLIVRALHLQNPRPVACGTSVHRSTYIHTAAQHLLSSAPHRAYACTTAQRSAAQHSPANALDSSTGLPHVRTAPASQPTCLQPESGEGPQQGSADMADAAELAPAAPTHLPRDLRLSREIGAGDGCAPPTPPPSPLPLQSPALQ